MVTHNADMDGKVLCCVRDGCGETFRFHFAVADTVGDLFKEVGDRFSYHPDKFELSITIKKEEGGYDMIILNEHKDKSLEEVGIHAEPGARNIFTLGPLKGVELRKVEPSEEELTLGASASPTTTITPAPPPLPPTDFSSPLEGPSSNYTSSASVMIHPTGSSIVPYVGLVNQAMTCYLNSLLQALFMTPEFRNALYHWEYDGTQQDESKSMPYQLQKLFLNLQTSSRSSVETTALTRSFGWDSSEAWQQHDIQELCRVMFDALEQKFKDTDEADLINRLYEGTMTDYVKCLECSTEKRRDDKFLDIPLPVRPFGSTVAYSSVEEALRAFVQPETLEGSNQYFCERCNKKCDAHKGLKFTKFPYLLTLHLKRFDFDYNTLNRIKLNDKVIFPERLNLNSFIPLKEEGESPGESAEESGVKCDDSSTTDSGSALDDDNCVNIDAPLTNSNHVDCQDDDEGIDVENSQESEKNRQNAGEPGPYIYDLFSIMIHSGSATGGHYYAYIKDLTTGEWYCFNDQSVTRITQDDIKKTYGGGRGYYSGAYSSSTNAYMLMYRQIDPVRNATAMSTQQFPEHIVNLLKRIEEQKELEYQIRAKEADMMRLKCYYYPPNQDIQEFRLCVNKDSTLKEATHEAYLKADFGFPFPIAQCRLVLYDKVKKTILCSYEGHEDSSMLDIFDSGSKSELLLEYRDSAEEFWVYRPGDINTKVLLINPHTNAMEYIYVRGNLSFTVGEYRAAVAKSLNTSPASVQIYVEKYAGGPEALEDDECTLHEKFPSAFSRVFVVAERVDHADKIVEAAQHIVIIDVDLSEVSQESLEATLRPTSESSRLAFQGNGVSAEDAVKSKTMMGDETAVDIRGPSPGTDREREGSPQPLPDPEDPSAGAHSDQSASEDSSLTDSERTIVGEAPGDNLAQLSPNTSPVAWEHNGSSPENETFDWKRGVLGEGDNEASNYYFSATPYVEEGKKMLRILVDRRITHGHLKERLQPFVGVHVDYFKIFRSTIGLDTEFSKPLDTLRSCHAEEQWTVRLGRALRSGETSGKIYLLDLKNPEQPEKFLCEWVIAMGAPVSLVKREILAEVKAKCGLDIPFSRCRLRMKKWKEATRPYLDTDKLEFSSSWDLYLQEFDCPEPVTNLKQRLVFIRQWCPSTMELRPFQEVVLDSNLVSELKQKISEVSGIPIENIDYAKGTGTFPCADMTIVGIHSDLEWNPTTECLDSVPLHIKEHGGVIIFRDNREKLKQLTHDEKKELMSHERGRSSKVFSQRKERALKIYLDNSPTKKRYENEVD